MWQSSPALQMTNSFSLKVYFDLTAAGLRIARAAGRRLAALGSAPVEAIAIPASRSAARLGARVPIPLRDHLWGVRWTAKLGREWDERATRRARTVCAREGRRAHAADHGLPVLLATQLAAGLGQLTACEREHEERDRRSHDRGYSESCAKPQACESSARLGTLRDATRAVLSCAFENRVSGGHALARCVAWSSSSPSVR